MPPTLADVELDTFSYDDDRHEYRIRGELRPSVTQTLKTGGIFDFSRIRPEVLEFKRILGSRVHAWTAEFDRGRDVDLTDLTGAEEGYARGWLKCRADLGFEVLEIEKQMVRPIAGIELGGTPDRKIKLAGRIYILDLKCCAAFHPGWRLQTADYVMMDTGRMTCNAYGRVIVRLTADGRYKWDPIDPAWDATDSAVAIAFAQTHVWRKNHRLL